MSIDDSLDCQRLTVRFGDTTVLDGLDLRLRQDEFTAIIGPNGSGKSTTLLASSRVHRLTTGRVLLDGKDIHKTPSIEIARRLALLPQSAVTPDDLTVRSLVSYGRYPHVRRLSALGDDDRRAIDRALDLAEVREFADRLVDTLSGGERQRAWISCALAQQTPWLLLDEPTTYLDLGHQLSVMGLLRRLHSEERIGVVTVLHELGHAASYADRIVVMNHGAIVADGPPAEVLTAELIAEVYGARVLTLPHPESGLPVVVPCA